MININIAILMIAFCGNLFLFGIAESNDHEVYQAQKKLKELGYNPGAIDEIWGKKTTSAIRRFQRDNGLHVTGQLDKQTREELIIKKLPSQRSFNEAIKRDDFITVKALIEAGVDVNALNKSGEAPLHIAAVIGYQKITALLIAEGANVNARNGRKLTPLHAAAWGDHSEIVALLITKGADINERNKDGATPLHAAALTGQAEAVKLLIANGADVSAKNNEGMTAKQMAYKNGHQSIVNLLEKHINQ